jgi:hypothetical protein
MSFQRIGIRSTPLRVRDLATLKKQGKLHLPDLQRGFVWTPERVKALFDSLYRGYPVGALLLWKPTWTTDEPPFLTRQWDLFPPNSTTNRGEREETPKILPGSYFVLDGQQRLTSLFQVIFQSRKKGLTDKETDLLVSLSSQDGWVESPFQLRSSQIRKQMREGLLVDAEVLFEEIRDKPGSVAIQREIGAWLKVDDPQVFSAFDRANQIRTAILGAEIIAYEIDADAQDDNVIEIFARLNQQGVRLRPGDLAAARLTGTMVNFRTKARDALSAPELSGFSAQQGGEEKPRGGASVDTDLLVRTAMFLGTGLIRYSDAEKRKLKAGKDDQDAYSKIEPKWDDARQGLTNAVKHFRSVGVPESDWLPYRYLLLIPAVAEAKGHKLGADIWIGWAILASLWGHYSGSAETTAQADAKHAAEGSTERLIESVKTRAKRVDSVIPQEEDFTENVLLEGGVLLALLVHLVRREAYSFPSEKRIASHIEPLEVHHIFPRAVLDRVSGTGASRAADRLGNLTLIFRTDNASISDQPPETYLHSWKEEHLKLHCIPTNPELWKLNHYEEFCLAREKALAAMVSDLLHALGADGTKSSRRGISDAQS